VDFHNEEALAILKRGGARVEGEPVRFPEKLVEGSLESCPRSVILRARNPKHDVQLGSGRVHYANGFGAIYISDGSTGEYRPATQDDLRAFVTLCDYLDNLHMVVMEILPQDVPSSRAHLVGSAILLSHTDKHVIVAAEGAQDMEALMVLTDLVRKETGAHEPVFSTGTTTTSPLIFDANALTKLVQAAARSIPFHITCGAMAGATAPITLAGTLVVQNAEVLAGVALAQLVNPGTPVLYGTFASVIDMHNGTYVNGGPEISMMNAVTAQLCRMYGLPLGYGTAGSVDSPLVDFQAGLEKTLGILLCALAGADLIHDSLSGQVGQSLSSSFGQMLLSDEVCNMVNRVIGGIRVDEESLALDVIAALGPGAEFMSSEHTLRHFREELFFPQLLNRTTVVRWKESEGMTALERAEERAKEIIAAHRPNGLDGKIQRAMSDLIDRFCP